MRRRTAPGPWPAFEAIRGEVRKSMTEGIEKLQRCGPILSTQSGGETILARLSDGCFYGLGEIGTLVWARLERPGTMAEVMEFVGNECDSLPESAASEIAAFIEELRREGLVEAAPAGAQDAVAQAPTIAGSGRHAFVTPRLDRGTLRHAASGNIGYYDGGLTTGGSPGGLS